MNRFGESLSSPAQREEICDSIRGSVAFRLFKSTIRRLGIEDSWFAFKRRTLEDMARNWLVQHGLQIEDGNSSSP